LLLLFSNPDCAACTDLLPEVAAWQQEHADQLTVALVQRGTAAAVLAESAGHRLTHLLLEQDNQVATAYQVSGTPSGVLVDSRGLIASPLAAGAPALRALVQAILHPPGGLRTRLRGAPIALDGDLDRAPAPAPVAAGDPAPALRLPDLDGTLVDLAESYGRPALLLFWNPGCGFCQRMLEELRAALAQPAPEAPRLVLIATGTVEANRAQAIPAPVLLDPSFSTGFAFGARGTPSAVLIDAAGRVAGPVVVGAQAVLHALRGAGALEPVETQPGALQPVS
jgi:thiol-disulfide isomerase/thioredoxin